jgi:OOP family OmpA-OmpF porin/outer membrane immunogenic protein
MKSLLIPAAALAAFALSPTAAAQSGSDNYRPDLATGNGHWFVAGNVGRTDGGTATRFGTGDFNLFESREGRKTGYGLVGGYRWKVSPMWGVGIEGGYTDLGNLVVRNAFRDDSIDQSDDTNALRGWQVGANARAHLTPAWYVGLRGGYFRASDNNARYYNRLGEELRLDSGRRDGRNSWYAGVGTGWNVTERFSVGVHYDYFRAKSGELRDPATGIEFEGPKRSTALLGLTGEYTF